MGTCWPTSFSCSLGGGIGSTAATGEMCVHGVCPAWTVLGPATRHNQVGTHARVNRDRETPTHDRHRHRRPLASYDRPVKHTAESTFAKLGVTTK